MSSIEKFNINGKEIDISNTILDVHDNDSSNIDLDITDEKNDILARFSNGHIRTMNFNSEKGLKIFSDGNYIYQSSADGQSYQKNEYNEILETNIEFVNSILYCSSSGNISSYTPLTNKYAAAYIDIKSSYLLTIPFLYGISLDASNSSTYTSSDNDYPVTLGLYDASKNFIGTLDSSNIIENNKVLDFRNSVSIKTSYNSSETYTLSNNSSYYLYVQTAANPSLVSSSSTNEEYINICKNQINAITIDNYFTQKIQAIDKETLDVENDSKIDFGIKDNNGNYIVIFKNGHIRTSNFYSANISTNELSNLDITLPNYIPVVSNLCADNRGNNTWFLYNNQLRNYSPILYLGRIVNPINNVFPDCHFRGRLYNLNINSIFDDILNVNIIGSGFKNYSKNISLYRATNLDLRDYIKNLGHPLGIMLLGDSLTDADTITQYIGKLISMDMIDLKLSNNSDKSHLGFQMLGIANSNRSVSSTYRNNDYSFSYENEGRSGWTCVSYLMKNVEMRNTYNSVDYYHISWITDGLQDKYGDYDYNKLIATPTGLYKMTTSSLTENVWNCFRSKVSDTINVSYENATDIQKEELVNYINTTRLQEKPSVPFYSLSEVEYSSGDHSFSFDAYLERYRTCDDSGNQLYFDSSNRTTRKSSEIGQILGYYKDGTASTYKIGEYVYDVLTNGKVRTPDVMFINLGTNDGLSKASTLSLVEKISSVIKAQLPDCLIILYTNADPYMPYIEGKSDTSNKNYNSYRRTFVSNLEKYAGNITTQNANNIFYSPAYFTQRQGGSAQTYYFREIGDDDNIIGTMSSGGDVHPDKNGYYDIGYALYSMLCYIAKLKNQNS